MFHWPDGYRAAVSVSFDDTRVSQADVGLPILDRHNVKATFYAIVESLDQRIDTWRSAAAGGHEIGNHTRSHPCSGNFPFSRDNALEDYTLARMERDIMDASDAIAERIGAAPTTFAYPCGQTFVGRGEAMQSYVPLIAKHFAVGRRAFDEWPNDPAYIDMAMITGMDFDRMSAARLQTLLEQTVADGRWLVLVGHDVGGDARQTVHQDVLDQLCAYCADQSNGIWIDTVAAIASHIQGQRASC